MDILDVLKGMKSGSNKTSLNVYGRAIDEITKLREQLALRDLEIMKLREDLGMANWNMIGGYVAQERWIELHKELATKFTPTHLQEWYQDMVGEVVAWERKGSFYDEKPETHLDIFTPLHAIKEFKA